MYRYANSDARVDVLEQTSQVLTLARSAPIACARRRGFVWWRCYRELSKGKKALSGPLEAENF